MDEYTFEWRIDGKVGHKSRVPLASLWEAFNSAADWARARPERSVSYFGPRIGRTLVDEFARDWLREVLTEKGSPPPPDPYVGLLWARLDGSFSLHKVRKAHAGYALEHVPSDPSSDIVYGTMRWAVERCWLCRGVWLAGAPALLWVGSTVDLNALCALPEIASHLYQGTLYVAKAEYDWQKRGGEFPYIRPTRVPQRIEHLSAHYPDATEDLRYVPTQVLEGQYGRRTVRSSLATPEVPVTSWLSMHIQPVPVPA